MYDVTYSTRLGKAASRSSKFWMHVVSPLDFRGVTPGYSANAIGRVFKGLDPMVPAAGSLVSGAAMLLPASLVVDRPWTLSPSSASMAAVLALAVLSTALAFTIYFRLIKTLGPMSTAAQAYLRVPIGVTIGVVFLGETLAATAWLGLACVVAGVVAMTMPATKRPQRS